MDEDSRRKMDTFIREIEGQFPSKVQYCKGSCILLNNTGPPSRTLCMSTLLM